MSTQQITLEMNFSDGEGTLRVGEDHPLVAVFRRSIEKGTWAGHWLYLSARPSHSETPRTLGTIAWTPGSRFLYFPGYAGTFNSADRSNPAKDKAVDHFSLELDETTSKFSEHVTAFHRIHSGTRSGNVHTGQLHPWFSLLLRNLDRYERLPSRFQFDLSVPSNDADRRVRAMLDKPNRHATYFPVPNSQQEHYFQVDVWAGRGKDWKNKIASTIEHWHVPALVENHNGEPFDFTLFGHDFGDDCGILAFLTRPSGRLLKAGLIHPTTMPIIVGSSGAKLDFATWQTQTSKTDETAR